jgi:hypothetical protein
MLVEYFSAPFQATASRCSIDKSSRNKSGCSFLLNYANLRIPIRLIRVFSIVNVHYYFKVSPTCVSTADIIYRNTVVLKSYYLAYHFSSVHALCVIVYM